MVQCGLYMYKSFNLAAAAYMQVRLIVRKLRYLLSSTRSTVATLDLEGFRNDSITMYYQMDELLAPL